MDWEFDEKGVLREHEQGRTGSSLEGDVRGQ